MYKNVKFLFQLKYNTMLERKLGRVGLWHQYRIAGFVVSLFLSCFSCAEKENCVDEIMTANVECTVLYPTGSIQLKYREEKLIGTFSSIFMPEQHEESIKQIKKSNCLESMLINANEGQKYSYRQFKLGGVMQKQKKKVVFAQIICDNFSEKVNKLHFLGAFQ